MPTSKIIIIGAGLTGLTLAYHLKKAGHNALIIEARDRLGGRIHTHYSENGPPVEMGATWIHGHHHQLLQLLQELDLQTFPQDFGTEAIHEPHPRLPFQMVQMPPSAPVYRIEGGTQKLITTLAKKLDAEQIITGEDVHSIIFQDDNLLVKTKSYEWRAEKVISTLPPQLLSETITTEPPMSDELRKVISRTHTWMGDAIKVALTYPTCFWKKDTFNGTAFSAGPLVEIHDHSDADNKRFALNGFLDGRLATKSSGERLTLVLGQLQKYHGDIVHTYIDYVETVWSSEDYTSPRNYTPVAQHQNHGHPLLLEPLLDNRLYIAGTETSTSEAGYMEGAVRSAHNILQQLKSTLPHTEDVS